MIKIWKLANFQIELLWKKILIFMGMLLAIDAVALFITIYRKNGLILTYERRIMLGMIPWIFLIIFMTLCIFMYFSFRQMQHDGKYSIMGLPGKINNGIASYCADILTSICVIAMFYCAQIIVLVILEKPVMLFAAQRELAVLGQQHQQYKEMFYALFTNSFLQSITMIGIKSSIYVIFCIISLSILLSHQTGKYLFQKMLYFLVLETIIILNVFGRNIGNLDQNEGMAIYLIIMSLAAVLSFVLTINRRKKMGV